MLRLLAILFCTACTALADDWFRYYVFDTTKTGKLHYEHGYDFVISDYASNGPSPKLSFRTEYRIYGCAQDSFTYTVEHCDLDVSRERYAKLRAAVREIPPEKLKTNKEQVWREGSSGLLCLDGKMQGVNATLDQPERAKLHALIFAFLDEVAPKETRQTMSRTIEGDFVPARPLTFEELLREPNKYDGKRVRVVGFYHGEFEGSTFGPSKKAIYEGSVWLDNPSTFAKPANVRLSNDTYNTIEGTFEAGPSGHMGGWPGAIVRYSKVTKSKP